MRKICAECGMGRDEFFFIYRPYSADEIMEGILERIPGIEITANTISGNKVQLIFKIEFSEAQKTKLDNFMESKSFVHDEEEEIKQRNEEMKASTLEDEVKMLVKYYGFSEASIKKLKEMAEKGLEKDE